MRTALARSIGLRAQTPAPRDLSAVLGVGQSRSLDETPFCPKPMTKSRLSQTLRLTHAFFHQRAFVDHCIPF